MKSFYRLFLLLTSMSSNMVAAQVDEPVIEWQRCYGGTGIDRFFDIVITPDSGYLLTGVSNSTDGDVSGLHGNYDRWIVKIDVNGNIQWQKCLGGTGYDDGSESIVTSDGNYVTVGTSNSTNGDITNNKGNTDVWLTELDTAGILLWNRNRGAQSFDGGHCIKQTPDNWFTIAGYTHSKHGELTGYSLSNRIKVWVLRTNSKGHTKMQKCLPIRTNAYGLDLTFDGGYVVAGNIRLTQQLNDFYIAKLDSALNLQWSKSWGSTYGLDFLFSVNQIKDSGFIVCGDFNCCNVPQKTDLYIARLDKYGDIMWKRDIGGLANDNGRMAIQTNDGGFAAACYVSSSSMAASGNHAMGSFDMFILKLDSLGKMEWKKCLGGTGNDYAYALRECPDGELIVAGVTHSNDYDVAGNHGSEDGWVVKLTSKYNYIEGFLYKDMNSNNTLDSVDKPLAYKWITDTITGRKAITDADGSYRLTVTDTAMHVISPQKIHYYNTSPNQHNVKFQHFKQTKSDKSFAAVPGPPVNDLKITLTPLQSFRLLNEAKYYITYSNEGTTTINTSVVFYNDVLTPYVSATVTPTIISADSIVWQNIILNPSDQNTIILTVFVDTPATAGDFVYPLAVILPYSTDTTPADNFTSWKVQLVAPLDPNDKLVSDTLLTPAQVALQPYLYYIVRFQNIGNDTAFNVKIIDNLSPLLDINSFEILAVSHPVDIDYSHTSRMLTFNYNGIMLPDSNVNEPGSHGFVHFRIKPATGLQLGDSIENKAFIYFDNYAPVVTNTAKTCIANPVSTSTIQTGSIDSFFMCFPNPVVTTATLWFQNLKHDEVKLTLYDIFGNVVTTSQTTGNHFVLHKKTPGVYFYKLSNGVSGKLVMQ